MRRFYILAVTAVLIPSVHADTWVADPDNSRVGFTATQQRTQFSGHFPDFSATVVLDPGQPQSASMRATINLVSVDTQYADRDAYLRDTEWFYTAMWPEANYVADSIVTTDQGYQAQGMLNLRGVEKTVPLDFSFESQGNEARMTATTVIDRRNFGVGQGDWSDTGWVGAEVKVEIDLALKRTDGAANGTAAAE